MKLIKTAAAGLILAFALALPAGANAADETLEGEFQPGGPQWAAAQ